MCGRKYEQLSVLPETNDLLRMPLIELGRLALAGMAQWIERWPANQRVTGSIPSQGTCVGCRPGPQCEGQPHIDVSLSLSPSLPLSLKINK